MKKLVLITVAIFAFSCKKESQESFGNESKSTVAIKEKELTAEELGKEIFEGKGNCISCHVVDKKVIGPSIQEIAKIYKDRNADIVVFLKGESKPIVDPSQYEIMKTYLSLTKTMSDNELKGIEAYVHSTLK